MRSRFSLILLSCFGMWTQARGPDPGRAGHVEMSDGLCRYGNRPECCWGRRQVDRGRCQPVCQQGCKHGECVAPDRCRCYPGYAGKACNQDLNECGLKPRPCKHRCMNTPGSYKCYCRDGFTMMPDGSCRNAQTCYQANCQYGCEVMKGAVHCTCPSPGLRLGPDRRTCVDVDECALGGAGMCPRRRKCVNTFGSFLCRCHLGFKLAYIDGRYTCIDKESRPFCSLNPTSPKCRCKGGGCKAVPKVTLEPHRPGTPGTKAPTCTTATTSTAQTTTTVTMATTSPDTTTLVTRTTPVSTTTTTPKTTTPVSTTTLVTTTHATPDTATAVTTTTPAATDAVTTLGLDPSTPTATAVALATATTTTDSLATTTVNNRINKDVTHRQRGDVHIPRQPSHNQVWEFEIELGNAAPDAARDDPDVFVRHCSFDHGPCDWMSERDGDLCWETAGGAAELKAGQRSIRGARLVIPVVPPWNHADLCLSFSHWLTGHHVGVLQLFVRKLGRDHRYSPALWSRTGGHGWRHTQVTLAANSLDKVVLKAERRNGRRGQIAVDDVTLRQGVCR
ncbi:nephronectin-like isoform 2-T2 [Aulostomus maculatus]